MRRGRGETVQCGKFGKTPCVSSAVPLVHRPLTPNSPYLLSYLGGISDDDDTDTDDQTSLGVDTFAWSYFILFNLSLATALQDNERLHVCRDCPSGTTNNAIM